MCISSENASLMPQIGQCLESGRGGDSFTPSATMCAIHQILKLNHHWLCPPGVGAGPCGKLSLLSRRLLLHLWIHRHKRFNPASNGTGGAKRHLEDIGTDLQPAELQGGGFVGGGLGNTRPDQMPSIPGARNQILEELTLASCACETYRVGMRLKQGQIWKCGECFVRIVRLERLEVGYKSFKDLKSSAGNHQQASKKEFCRMLKGATLLTGEANFGSHET
jgi:hypothetical protein